LKGEEMRIAVLADIHGNLTALDAVLEDAKNRNVNGFIIAGDHVGDGPQPGEVMERIKKLRGWTIKGNREEYIISFNDGLHKDWENCNQMYVTVWTQQCLDSSKIAYLKSLPNQLVVNIPGVSPIRVVHGSPLDVYEHLYPNKHMDRLKKAVNSISEPVLVCGHTHESWSRMVDGKLIVNPGSVGLHFNDKICSEYTMLSWDGEYWQEEHIYVKYNICEVEKAFEKTGLLNTGGNIWAKATMCSIKTGRNVAADFLEFAYNFARKEGLYDIKLIPNEIWNGASELWNWDY
jgi:putative phosphoesterase